MLWAWSMALASEGDGSVHGLDFGPRGDFGKQKDKEGTAPHDTPRSITIRPGNRADGPRGGLGSSAPSPLCAALADSPHPPGAAARTSVSDRDVATMRRHATRSVRGGFGSFDLPISAMRASSGITPHAQGIEVRSNRGWAVARRPARGVRAPGRWGLSDERSRRATRP